MKQNNNQNGAENMTKVEDLKVGQEVKFNNTTVFVRSIKADRVMVSKQKDGNCLLSMSFFSGNFDDCKNRTEVAC